MKVEALEVEKASNEAWRRTGSRALRYGSVGLAIAATFSLVAKVVAAHAGTFNAGLASNQLLVLLCGTAAVTAFGGLLVSLASHNIDRARFGRSTLDVGEREISIASLETTRT